MLMKSSTEQIRRQNSALVLAALRVEQAMSHTQIAAVTGLASATVTAITSELEQAGVIERHEQQIAGARGRPRVALSRRRDFAYVMSVRISSDRLNYTLSDFRGKLMDRFEEPRPLDVSAAGFIEGLGRNLARLASRSKLEPEKVAVLSVSSKGIVDAGGARLLWTPVFGQQPLDLKAALGDFEKAMALLSNETLLVAHGLSRRMDAQDGTFRGLIALSLGHSIGLGIARPMPDGTVAVSAPNFGHMLNTADSKLCRCGARGCIEASAGFYGILRMAFEVRPDTIPAKFVPITEMDKIALSARQGNRMAQYAFRQAGLALGQGLSRVFSLHETLPVTITGPGTRYYDLLAQGLEEGLAQSLQVRLDGAPPISLVGDEADLVQEGHVDHALRAIDERLFGGG
ncbi:MULTISPECIES: ROK family transcriptional regulator [Rhizobium/Agrobacterium group]|uniref:Transcriptional regulator n=2 Tax=Rhizobium/Agrobacterium group TaxID=227290 RepID=B9JTF3_ALLAM|nr:MULTISPECIES: ROK family transcriptional regulator [Rhizobium/Agrobacterium group]ACM35866.1 transcriptional regulator [Allorhizobium ampelinum S4]MCF1448342.1 ROK family transcriptional regulator [Allorhizobium ampelinum]MCF1491983.1 ROK family transcriptional regulator [Allorhizobium ampelinum]MUO30351.1 ROK family protein [Agrobacterium vitis]MUO44653.1 ROK family protein [Agrobacterium vitis]